MRKFDNLYLAFSGDIVREGKDSGQYTALEAKFAKAFDSAGVPRNRRICCPGNHDISQTELNRY
jgi:hypothetical protein